MSKFKGNTTKLTYFPKFISKSILGNEKVKQAYTIGVDGFEYSQDTPKEDYILCPSCEKYFSVLEKYTADRFHNRIRDVRHSDQFISRNSGVEIAWKECVELNPIIFRLFIYSIIWRCSVSSTRLCQGFKLLSGEKELIRNSLLVSKSENQASFLQHIATFERLIILIPFVFSTSESIRDNTTNILFPHKGIQNPYQIMLNEYMLIFSFKENEMQSKFKTLNNNDNSKIKVVFLQQELWVSAKGMIKDMVGKGLKEFMLRTGKNPLLKKM